MLQRRFNQRGRENVISTSRFSDRSRLTLAPPPPSPPLHHVLSNHPSFTLTITYVFMNLFIGVILDGFDAASANDHDVIKQEDFARFAHHWAEYDPRATCFISVQARKQASNPTFGSRAFPVLFLYGFITKKSRQYERGVRGVQLRWHRRACV